MPPPYWLMIVIAAGTGRGPAIICDNRVVLFALFS